MQSRVVFEPCPREASRVVVLPPSLFRRLEMLRREVDFGTWRRPAVDVATSVVVVLVDGRF